MGAGVKKPVFPPDAAAAWRHRRYLDKGGQGNVFEVECKKTRCKGVLKVLQNESSPTARQRFEREISVLGNIEHPNIVKLLDAHKGGGAAPWYVSPLGTPLSKAWKRAPTPTLHTRAAKLIEELLDGLAIVHKAQVVHRDIKPANIVLLDDRPVLIDFGLAIRPQEDERLTKIDNRPVANHFIVPAAAYYGEVDNVRPSWDCLSMAWVWAWLLSVRQPVANRFHWRFHEFFEESPRTASVRAVLAACSDEELCPEDAAAMLELARGIGALREREPPARPKTTIVAHEAYTKAKARNIEQTAARREQLHAIVELQAVVAQQLLDSRHAILPEGDFPIAVHLQLADDLRTALLELLDNKGNRELFMLVAGNIPRQQLLIEVWATTIVYTDYSPSIPPDLVLPIRFDIRWRHDSEAYASSHFGVYQQRDGSLTIHSGEPTTIESIISKLSHVLADPILWEGTP